MLAEACRITGRFEKASMRAIKRSFNPDSFPRPFPSILGAVISTVLSTATAAAQNNNGDGTEAELAEVVVVGSRGTPRLVTESSSPIDLIDGEQLRATGLNDLSKALQFLAPSVNFPRSATGPSAANTRGVTLRGLSPDQVLVLVDGKRRHASSVLNFNNVVGRGTVPVDLNAIPLSAVGRVEILRDGAAAQYGSDAIAGVVNIVLRGADSQKFTSLQAGATEDGDGETAIVAAGTSFDINDGGGITVTAESRYRDFTNSAGLDSRVGRITNRQGDPESLDLGLVVNARMPVGDNELYGNIIVSQRDSESAAQYRAPNVSPLYPAGFLPLIDLDMLDLAATAGWSRPLNAWTLDVSNTFGSNRADFKVSDSVNTSLGASSPLSFDAGGTRYQQNVFGVTLTRPLEGLSGANLAVGVESRYEAFEIENGEPASLVGAGAQGFPGFNPPGPIDESRNAWSAFVDAELHVTPALSFGAAARYEDYSDFGDEVTGKLSTMFKPTSVVAFRATGSTGFRAPSLQQQSFSTVSSQSSGGVLVNVGTFAVDDPVARALGAQSLQAETSEHVSAGIVLTPMRGLTLSLDAFRIDIEDRIILSESLSGAGVSAILQQAGITNASQVRFFTNAADTKTEGYELTAAWRGTWFDSVRSELTLGYMSADTTLERVKDNSVIPSIPLLGLASIDLLTEAQPEDKLTFSSLQAWGAWQLRVDVTRFGEYRNVPVIEEQQYGTATTVDVGIDCDITPSLRLSVGVLNATDAYPDKIAQRALLQGGSLQYSEAGGLGTDGREYYARFWTGF
jgi:iron complex outermembrane receptor protein